jgi:hypothetical protein
MLGNTVSSAKRANKVVNLMRFAPLCSGFAILPQNSTSQIAQVTTALAVKIKI